MHFRQLQALTIIAALGSACSDSSTDPDLQANEEVAFVSTALRVHMLRLRIADADANATPRALADTSNIVYDFSWSPDGQRIAYEGLDGQFQHYFAILSVSSGTETRLAVTDGGRIHLSGEFWSPDGRFIVRQEFGGRLEIMAPDGSGRRLLAPRAFDFAWARHGEELIVPAYPTHLTPSTSYLRINPATGDSVRVAFPRGGVCCTEQLAAAPDGEQFAYINALDRSIVITTLDGREIKSFPAQQLQSFLRPRWSPNGRWILVHSIVQFEGSAEWDESLVRFDVDTNAMLTVASGLPNFRDAQWSADSKRIAYSGNGPDSDGEATGYIHIVNADGTNDRVIPMPPSFSYKPKWRPAGNSR